MRSNYNNIGRYNFNSYNRSVTVIILFYLVDLFPRSKSTSSSGSRSRSGILLTLKPELFVEGIIFCDLDGVTLGVEVLELDVAAFETLAQMSGLLGSVRNVVRDELAPHGGDHHQVRMFSVMNLIKVIS
jgi:hypothetical protein